MKKNFEKMSSKKRDWNADAGRSHKHVKCHEKSKRDSYWESMISEYDACDNTYSSYNPSDNRKR